MLTSHKIRTK